MKRLYLKLGSGIIFSFPFPISSRYYQAILCSFFRYYLAPPFSTAQQIPSHHHFVFIYFFVIKQQITVTVNRSLSILILVGRREHQQQHIKPKNSRSLFMVLALYHQEFCKDFNLSVYLTGSPSQYNNLNLYEIQSGTSMCTAAQSNITCEKNTQLDTRHDVHEFNMNRK